MGNIYEIGDGTGSAFKIWAESPAKMWEGSWRTIDKGFIRFNSGELDLLYHPNSGIVFDDMDACLISKDGTWGMRLNLFTGKLLYNDRGTGVVQQPWVLKLKPGTISWIKL